MSKATKYILLVILFSLLAMIRFFENELFYDPYLTFFQNDYLYIDNPRREVFKLTAFTTLRYVMNSVLSLGILYVFFKDKSIVKFSGFLYFVMNPKQEDYYLFFNIRRFLIQPIILLLLLPAFYYYKQKQ